MAALRWTPLPKGCFTGIEWSRPGATNGFDPYLIWAEADMFAGYGLKKPPKWLPLLMELAQGVSVDQLVRASSPQWLHVPPAYRSDAAPSGLRYCTARVKPRFFKEIRPGGALDGLIARCELGLPAGHHADDPTAPLVATPSARGARLDGKVLGLIDGGLAFANEAFLRSGKTRVRHFWRQDRQGLGPAPNGFGYGHELSGSEIDRAMRDNTFGGLVDETRVYTHFEMGTELDKRVNHGTHVLGVAAGPRTVRAGIANVPPHYNAPPSWAAADDDASRCHIVGVQLDWDTVLDTSGGSMNVHIMDGLMYILSRCERSAKIVVNVSWGTLAGPHDGTSLLESAMDQLIELVGPRRFRIILPAGNSYQERTHANGTLAPGADATLHWRCQAQDVTQNFLELWLPPSAEGISLTITPPGRAPLPALRLGQSGTWADAQGRSICALIYPASVATGTNGTCALLAIAPTFSFDAERATAPSGAWQIKLANEGSRKTTFDAYIERDDEIIGVQTGARQSHFEDPWYDISGNPGSFVDHPDNPSLIRRSGSFNSIGTGANTTSVGGTRVSGPTWALYSPRKPDPDASRPSRPGVVKVPAVEAPADENDGLLGLNGASTRSGGFARLVGTSDAAPQIARKVLNGM